MNPHFSLILAQSPAPDAASPAAPPQNPLGAAVPFILMAVIFYFLLIRPQQKRQRELTAMISAVKTGDNVVMNGGIHGIVTNVKDATLIVKVADNVKIEFDKSAVARVEKTSAES